MSARSFANKLIRDQHESDIETLKAWCHWKKKETDVSDDDLEFVKAIEDTISQVNNWKVKHDRLLDQAKEADRHLRYLSSAWEAYQLVGKEKMAIRKMLAPLNAAREALGHKDIASQTKELK